MAAPYRIYGMDASFFTQKVLSYFAYKEIPTAYHKKTVALKDEIEKKSGTHLIPVVETPEGGWLTDSTHIAFEMDRRFPDSLLLPDAPLARMMARILEDYIDEWLTLSAMHYRWINEPDRSLAGQSLARDFVGIPQDAVLDAQGKTLISSARDMITHWAMGMTEKLDCGLDARPEIEGDWIRLVTLLNQHFKHSTFLLGPRPCLADFALYGAVVAHFIFDPTPRKVVTHHGPQLLIWRDRMHKVRAGSEVVDWPVIDSVPETLAPLLQHIAMGFHPYLLGNHQALSGNQKFVRLDQGYGVRQIIARQSTERTRLETAQDFAGFSEKDKQAVQSNLEPLGVLAAYTLAL